VESRRVVMKTMITMNLILRISLEQILVEQTLAEQTLVEIARYHYCVGYMIFTFSSF